MKKLSLELMCLMLSTMIFAQPTITEVKRYMSQGEKTGYKIILPNQRLEKFEKPNTKNLAKYDAESVKPPKGSNELIFQNIKLKGVDNSILLYNIMEQEGKNIGWTGYFFNQKDTSNVTDKNVLTPILTSVYNASMYQLYDDSIYAQQKFMEDAQSTLDAQSKSAGKNQKEVNSSKQKISDAESEIEKSKKKIESAKESFKELESKKSATESKLKDAEKEMKKVEEFEDGMDELKSKQKKLNKNLAELKKDPATNANLIIAQELDINKISEEIGLKQAEYERMKSAGKSALKDAERENKKAVCDLKDAEKVVKKEEDRIQDLTEKIVDNKKIIEANEKSIENFQSTEKGKSESSLEEKKKRLEELKTLQKAYM